MSVPYADAAELAVGGTAAFLRVLPGGHDRDRRGGLFQVNARAEPVEFTFNRIEVPESGLWLSDDLERQAAKALAVSLFEAARRTPLVLLCLAGEVDAGLFERELEVRIPVCRVAAGEAAEGTGPGPGEVEDVMVSGEGRARLFWRHAVPSRPSPARRLLAALADRGFLLEPFDRVTLGFAEAFAGARPGP